MLCFRLSPYEWDNPHPCVDEPEELENELTLHNCFWHNWGSLMQQGSDIAPKYVVINSEREIFIYIKDFYFLLLQHPTVHRGHKN
jgi:hypothetical protein